MLIAIDHGNYAIKTPHHSFVSGLSEHTVKPPMADEILEYDGRYWTTSGKRLSYMRDKTQDERYFILTLFAIAKELEDTGRYSPVEQIQLAVGLPPEHYGVLKDKFARYFKREAVQVKVNANREEPLLEKKAAMLKRTLQRAQNSKLDLYEEYRNGRMTRDKFITAQEERQTAIDSMRDELAATEATITKLRVGKEKAAVLEADAKGIQLLNGYRPKELRKLIEKVRVYENGRIEIDFRCHDDFTEEIIKAVARQAG